MMKIDACTKICTLARMCRFLCNYNFPFANRKLENLSFRTCTYTQSVCNAMNLLQKFSKLTLLHCRLQNSGAHNVTTVWEFAAIYCNFVIANPIYFCRDSFHLLLFCELFDACEQSCKNFNIALSKFHWVGHAVFYLPNWRHNSNNYCKRHTRHRYAYNCIPIPISTSISISIYSNIWSKWTQSDLYCVQGDTWICVDFALWMLNCAGFYMNEREFSWRWCENITD